MTDQPRPDHDPSTDPTTVHPTAVPTTPVATGPVPAAPAVPPTADVGGPGVAAGAAVAAVATAPATTAPRRRSRIRLIAAAAVVALVVGVSAIATLALTGASPTATVMGYVPADSVMYAELRLDLPGDQRRQVGEFLSKFPGFADQAALDSKLDEVLDQLVSSGTDGEQTFTRDIKPWFDGELAVAAGPLPTKVDASDPAAAAADARALALISIKDADLASAWFADAMGKAGASGTTRDYEGTQLTVFSDPKMPGAEAAVAIVDGKVAIAGDLASVKAAVDTKGDSGFADDPDVKAALGATEDDSLGFVFVDIQAIMKSALTLSESVASAPPVSDALLALVPDWASGRLRVESDALVIDGAMPNVDGAPGPDQNDANGVASWAPPTTVALAAGNDYGATLLETIEQLRKDPALADGFTQVDGAAGIVGGLDAALGWMGDSGVVIAEAGDTLEGGIVSIPADAAAASQLLTTLRSFATLGGGDAGIKVTEEDYAGTTITIIDLGSAADLAGMAGALSGGAVPSAPMTGLPEGNIQIAYAATPDVVVIGSGPAFVKSVLDAGAGESLADTARYKDLVGRVGAEHTGVAFVDIAAMRGVIEGKLSEATAAERAEYEESVKPFLQPLDAFIAASTTSTDLNEHHALITVK